MKVQTSAFSAEYGRNSGGSVNVVTKGGGNSFHGSLFETIRNEYVDAKDYFAPVKPELRFNDYGWSLGGPVAKGPFKKGKLFFFAGEEWKKIRRFTSASRQTLPALAEVAGDLSDRSTTTIDAPGTKNPLPSKNLTNLMTPDGRAVLAVYGAMIKLAAAYSNTPTSNNATFQVLNPFNWREDIARLDYHPPTITPSTRATYTTVTTQSIPTAPSTHPPCPLRRPCATVPAMDRKWAGPGR